VLQNGSCGSAHASEATQLRDDAGRGRARQWRPIAWTAHVRIGTGVEQESENRGVASVCLIVLSTQEGAYLTQKTMLASHKNQLPKLRLATNTNAATQG
jgi:hypothetical protein